MGWRWVGKVRVRVRVGVENNNNNNYYKKKGIMGNIIGNMKIFAVSVTVSVSDSVTVSVCVFVSVSVRLVSRKCSINDTGSSSCVSMARCSNGLIVDTIVARKTQISVNIIIIEGQGHSAQHHS